MTDLTPIGPDLTPWRFLLAPEDSTPPWRPALATCPLVWQALKTLLWAAVSVLAALGIGQL